MPDHKKTNSRPEGSLKLSQRPAEDSLRLNKALAEAGVCSRRKADDLISGGHVRLNGEIVRELGIKIMPSRDLIQVDGKKIDLKAETRFKRYVLLNKPVQIVCTASDPEGRKTVLDILPEEFRRTRLFTIGRLDYFSEGLLLLTDDGELTHKLTHPAFHIPRKYRVLVREEPNREQLEAIRRGMTLKEGEKLAPVEVTASSHQKGFVMDLTLRQGINRQIRRMCRDLGLTILRLVRTDFGPLNLGSLQSGQCRELQANEISSLRLASEGKGK